MTVRERQIFAQGLVLGAVLAAWRQHEEIVALDLRLRLMGRPVPAGWRQGQRLFRIAGRF